MPNMVLLVDDDPVFSQLTKAPLSDTGTQVVTAYNKQDGLDPFGEYHSSCVIQDIFLPDGGVDLMKPFRSAGSSIPISMVSGRSGVEEVVRAMKDGANETISRNRSGVWNSF